MSRKEAESAQNGDILELDFSKILISIPTKYDMRITNITLVFGQILQ
jgi:hypothetical protein